MGGKDHPQGAVRAPGRGPPTLCQAMSACHQPHQELVGPGHSESRGDALVPGAERQDRLSRYLQNRGGPSPPPQLCTALLHPSAHPCSPGAVPCSSVPSVTWNMQTGVSCREDPTASPPASPLNGG